MGDKLEFEDFWKPALWFIGKLIVALGSVFGLFWAFLGPNGFFADRPVAPTVQATSLPPMQADHLINLYVDWNGHNAEAMESEVGVLVEDGLKTLDGISEIRSIATTQRIRFSLALGPQKREDIVRKAVEALMDSILPAISKDSLSYEVEMK